MYPEGGWTNSKETVGDQWIITEETAENHTMLQERFFKFMNMWTEALDIFIPKTICRNYGSTG